MFSSTFSKNYNLTLKQFGLENKGNYVVGKYDNQDSVELFHNRYKIIFDSYINYTVVSGSSLETEYSRVRLEFISPDKLLFKIVNQGFYETIQKIFGGKDIKIGNEEFDKKYVITGNDDFKIQTLFSIEKIQNLILKLDSLRIEIFENEGFFGGLIKPGNSVLYFISDKELENIIQFNILLELFKLIIDNLDRLGSSKPLETRS